jgi:hypothetical protein
MGYIDYFPHGPILTALYSKRTDFGEKVKCFFEDRFINNVTAIKQMVAYHKSK